MHSGAGSRSGQKLVIPRYHPPQNCSAECRLTTIALPRPRLIGGAGGQEVGRRWPGGGQEVAAGGQISPLHLMVPGAREVSSGHQLSAFNCECWHAPQLDTWHVTRGSAPLSSSHQRPQLCPPPGSCSLQLVQLLLGLSGDN